MSNHTATALLVAATALHAGFQLTVTAIVYPALAQVPDDHWSRAHAAHSRRITPVVVLVYGAALLGCIAGLTADRGPGTWVAVAGTGLAFLVTATLAAPLHGRLTARDPRLLGRLLVADRVRCGAACVALAGALAALAGSHLV